MTIDHDLEPWHSELDLSEQEAPQFYARGREESVNSTEDLSSTHKRIVICADGTWNAPPRVKAKVRSETNVWLMYQAVKPRARDGTPQLAYYHPGVGTRKFQRLIGGMIGWGLARNVLDCYRFLVEQYQEGDSLYLFGFSRGAYTVRTLSGLIRNSGVINRAHFRSEKDLSRAINDAWKLYRGRGEDTAPRARKSIDFREENSHSDFRITCIGVWDTVGALGIPVSNKLSWLRGNRYEFHDVTLSSRVDCAFHALAIDEQRGPFTPTLWVQQPGASQQGQVLEQVWFPGVHTDVGGGYAWGERTLANIALRWMMNRVSTYCRLELSPGDIPPLEDGMPTMHNSMTWYYKMFGLADRTIDAGLGQTGLRDGGATTEQLHTSADYLTREFAATALPGLRRPYAPESISDFRARMEKSRSAQPRPVVQPNDLKPRTTNA